MKKLIKKLLSKKGEMLVETIIGAALLTVLMAALVTMLLSATSFSLDAFKLNKHNNDNTKALNIGEGTMEANVVSAGTNFTCNFEITTSAGTSTYTMQVPGADVTATVSGEADKLFMFVPDDI